MIYRLPNIISINKYIHNKMTPFSLKLIVSPAYNTGVAYGKTLQLTKSCQFGGGGINIEVI